jgi:hypothetical protein
MDQTKIGWIAFAVALFVYLDLLFVELRRMGREGRRIVTRVMAYADLPVVAQAARAGDDAERLGRALEAVTPLLERGSVALATIRRPAGGLRAFRAERVGRVERILGRLTFGRLPRPSEAGTLFGIFGKAERVGIVG